MYIKFSPKNAEEYVGRPISTNLGDFIVGQVAGPFEGPELVEAQRLVENGDGFEDVSGEETPKSNAATEGASGTTRRAPQKKR